MAKLRIPSPCGDEVLEFDRGLIDETMHQKAFAEEIGPEHAKVREAMERFNTLVNQHKMLAATRPGAGEPFTKVGSFQNIEEETTFMPHLQGG